MEENKKLNAQDSKLVTRRSFLLASGAVIAAGALSSCAQSASTKTITKTVTGNATKAGATTALEFTVLNPVAQDPDIQIKGLSPRLDTVKGKKINVINLHGGNEQMIENVAPELKKAIPECNAVNLKPTGGFNAPAFTTDDWTNMLDCDGAILGNNF